MVTITNRFGNDYQSHWSLGARGGSRGYQSLWSKRLFLCVSNQTYTSSSYQYALYRTLPEGNVLDWKWGAQKVRERLQRISDRREARLTLQQEQQLMLADAEL